MKQPRNLARSNFAILLSVLAATLSAPMLSGCAANQVVVASGTAVVPAILTQPVSQTVVLGQNAGFGVSVSGNPPFTYQWYMNSKSVAGATNNTFIVQGVTAAQNGAKIYVIVGDATGDSTSATATLTVTGIGVNNTASLGCSSTTPVYGAAISVTPTFAAGTGVIGSTGVNSSNVATAAVSGTNYTTGAVTGTQTFTLTVTGLNGGTSTTTATCKATATNVSISGIQPNGTTVAPGTLSFSANVSGGATNAVTWSANGGTFSGSTWTTPTTAGAYTITATSVDNPAVHATVLETVSAPVITKQPVSSALCVGSSATLAATANYATSYQWYLGGSAIAGAVSSTYLIPSASATDVGTYMVAAINPAGTATSQAITVSVGSTVLASAANVKVGLLQPATFAVSAAGKAPFTYQWYVQPAKGTAFVQVPWANSNSYSVTAVSDSNGNEYYATIKDSCGNSFTTTPALLGVSNLGEPPIITLQPVGAAIPVGGTYTFRTDTTSATTPVYQWYRIPAGGTAGVAIPGANAVTYTVPASATNLSNDQDGYYQVITNTNGLDLSATATIAVGPGIFLPPSGEPETVSENAGEVAVFSVNATSTLPLSYQWYSAAPGSSSFGAIAGATASSYTIPATTLDQNGSNFYVVVSDGQTAAVTSTTAGLWVSQLPMSTNLCDSWVALGYATAQANCGYQLTPAKANLTGAVMWPKLVPTANMMLTFTVSTTNTSPIPGEGFALAIGDPSLGATTKSLGSGGLGLGANGIPGFAITFNIDGVTGGPTTPFLGNTFNGNGLYANPWIDTNNSLAPLAAPGVTTTHTFLVIILNDALDITMDGLQIFHGDALVPPVGYIYFTAANGSNYEQLTISNLTAIVAPQ
jgi:hypothetical protein